MPSSSALGALFDWDGVVIDSAQQHERSWQLLARETGRSLPEYFFKRSFGMKNEAILPGILGWTEDPAEIRTFSLRKEELYREILKEDGIEPLPGVRAFLETLKAAGVPCAIGSSTHRLNIDTCLERFGFTGFFTGIISAENVGKGKPDPDVFLKAAQLLGVPPERCVVFEDAPVGIEAGLRGGMKVVGVSGTHPDETLAGAHRIVKRLDTLTIDDLKSLWTQPAPPVSRDGGK
jgi:beta-phosphoglucomutase family hydrolase